MISKHVTRAVSRPNGRKAIKRLCADLETLIDRAPASTPFSERIRVHRDLGYLRHALEIMYMSEIK